MTRKDKIQVLLTGIAVFAFLGAVLWLLSKIIPVFIAVLALGAWLGQALKNGADV